MDGNSSGDSPAVDVEHHVQHANVGETSRPDNTGGEGGMSDKMSFAPANPMRKTKLCKAFTETGNCEFGDECWFAHGEHELRKPGPLHPRQRMCKFVLMRRPCPYGLECYFAHSAEELRAALKEPTATPPPRKPGPRPPFGFPFRGPAPMRPGRPPFGGSRYRPPIPRRPIRPQAFRGRPPFPPGGRGYPRAPMPGAMHPAAPQATAPHARAGGMTQAGDVAGFARMQGGYAAVGYGQHATAADAQLQHGGAHHPQHQHQHQLHQQGLQQQQQQHHQQHQQQAFGMTAHTTPAAVQSAATLAQFTHHPSPAQQSMHAHQQHQHQHQQQHAQQQQHQHQHQQHQQQQQQQQVPSAAYYDQYFFAGAYTQQGVAQSPVPALSPVTAPAPQAFGGFAAQQLQASPMPQTTNAQATGAYFHFQAEHMQ